ncbi:hypothetical protein M8A51_05355 [Schlegelella sp. S2-27]|uniref:DUF4405 domain-containing protein n=1 Tax=Caldimonas mangrovi TaxID=2944811 RepID=A0ABT0YJQ1_9BURK|nr:hypothetical protein [Caldimonas mangrovi]MCM5678955.1 hypothetical protein [Caldimonas mangrovi]
MSWRYVHLGVGVLGLLAFVLSGQYMHWVHDHLRGMPDGPRLFYRSVHIYLLWSALLNLALAGAATAPGHPRWAVPRMLASTAVAVGPALLAASFLLETYNAALLRPMARWAIYAAVGGVLVHTFTSWTRSPPPAPARPSRP